MADENCIVQVQTLGDVDLREDPEGIVDWRQQLFRTQASLCVGKASRYFEAGNQFASVDQSYGHCVSLAFSPRSIGTVAAGISYI